MEKIFVNNDSANYTIEDYQYIAPVSSFDPYYHAATADMTNKSVAVLEINNNSNEIKVVW